MAYPPVSEKIKEKIKEAVLENPKIKAKEFFALNPKVHLSAACFLKYRFICAKEAGREDELPTRQGHNKPCDYTNKEKTKLSSKIGTSDGSQILKPTKTHAVYTRLWRFSCEEFNKDPIAGLQSFIESINRVKRNSIGMIKTEELIDGKWIPHYEVRES